MKLRVQPNSWAHFIIIHQDIHLEMSIHLAFASIDDNQTEDIFTKQTQIVDNIDLQGNKITSVGLRSFSHASWPSLTCLLLNGNKIGSTGCIYLSQAQLPMLEELWLGKNSLTDSGVQHLCKSALPSLHTIGLWENQLTGESLVSLSRANWSQLKTISLQRNYFTYEELLRLVLLQTGKYYSIQLCEINQLHRRKLSKLLKEMNNDKCLNFEDSRE